MATDVLVPPLGQTVDTVTLAHWYKHEGDVIAQGEPLFAVETDKATLDVEALASGILRGVSAQAGDAVKVLSVIARLAQPGEDLSAAAPVPVEPAAGSAAVSEASAPAEVAKPRRRLFVSPRARRLAEKEGVPLEAVRATGPEGAIVERDVRAYLVQPGEPRITPVARRMAEGAGLDWRKLRGSGGQGRVMSQDVRQALAQAGAPPAAPRGSVPIAQPSAEPVETVPFSSVRAVVAERMASSHSQTAPVTLTTEADATALVKLRGALAHDGIEASYTDLFACVLGRALRDHPALNASLEGDHIRRWREVHLGVAVDTERGLLAPVIRNVDRKGLRQIAEEMKDLTERARAGLCTPDELRGSTFTLTNLGMFGIDAFTPLINLPECAILGVGRIKAQPVVVEGAVVGREMVWLSLTFDHRLVDGGPAARFLQRMAQLIERPHLLIA
jgi:pyruvate dehydrogenase E2 component (dihydrolipoamide acetyltransferase)